MTYKERQDWLDALRSDKFKQTRNRLRFKESYCCLGVLCEINECIFIPSNDGASGMYEYQGTQEYCSLPRALHQKFKLKTSNVWIEGLEDRVGANQTLTLLNDNGLSFSQIADVIEYFIPVDVSTEEVISDQKCK